MGTSSKAISYSEFWELYLDRHRSPFCRFFHYLGVSLSILFFLIFLANGNYLSLLLSLLLFYSFPWVGSIFFEKRRPMDFYYLGFSSLGHFHLYYLWLLGILEEELLEYHS